MKALTLSAAKDLIGKTIKWTAPGYHANGNYSGTDKIISVDPSDRRPIKAKSLEGDQLWFAFQDPNPKSEFLCYSDSDRFVSYQEI